MEKKAIVPLTRISQNTQSGHIPSDHPMTISPALLTYAQAAQFLGIGVAYLKELKASGKIPWVPMGNRGVRFSVKSLEVWIKKREIG